MTSPMFIPLLFVCNLNQFTPTRKKNDFVDFVFLYIFLLLFFFPIENYCYHHNNHENHTTYNSFKFASNPSYFYFFFYFIQFIFQTSIQFIRMVQYDKCDRHKWIKNLEPRWMPILFVLSNMVHLTNCPTFVCEIRTKLFNIKNFFFSFLLHIIVIIYFFFHCHKFITWYSMSQNLDRNVNKCMQLKQNISCSSYPS